MAYKGSRLHVRIKAMTLSGGEMRKAWIGMIGLCEVQASYPVTKPGDRAGAGRRVPLGGTLSPNPLSVHTAHVTREGFGVDSLKLAMYHVQPKINKLKWTDASQECSGFGGRYCN